MQKVLIIGCPGSGKSTFARTLSPLVDLPLFYIDQLYWNANRTTVGREILQQRLQKILATDRWILDGNYAGTLAMRLEKADTVFLLDYPTELCLQGIRARRGLPRPDLPWVEVEEDPEFTDYVRAFRDEQLPKVQQLLAKFPDLTVIRFSDRAEADAYLETVKNAKNV